jgi:hypothetical protein
LEERCPQSVLPAPQGLKSARFLARGGTAEEVPEKVAAQAKSLPQALKRGCTFKDLTDLSSNGSFSATSEAVPFPDHFMR